MSSSVKIKKKQKKSLLWAAGVGLLSITVIKKITRGEPIQNLIANTLFLVPFVCQLAPFFWKDPSLFLPDKAIHTPIREITADEYTYEKLREVSENFYYPTVVRGIFNNTIALKRWTEDGYLSRKLGKFMVPTNFCQEFHGEEMKMATFADAFQEILYDKQSKHCLFFPFFSRSENQTPMFKRAMQQVAREDLRLDLIRPGFASESHKNLHGCQMVVGRGLENATLETFTGLGWHTEPGTNWYAQVVGRKKWFLMDPKDSNLMIPFLETTAVFRTTDVKKMNELHDRLPLHHVVLNPGDLLYNVDWWWHRTSAYPGLTISVPMREVFPERAIRNNWLYTFVISRFYLLQWGIN